MIVMAELLRDCEYIIATSTNENHNIGGERDNIEMIINISDKDDADDFNAASKGGRVKIGNGYGQCWKCGEWGHPRWECPKFIARMGNKGGDVAVLKGGGWKGIERRQRKRWKERSEGKWNNYGKGGKGYGYNNYKCRSPGKAVGKGLCFSLLSVHQRTVEHVMSVESFVCMFSFLCSSCEGFCSDQFMSLSWGPKVGCHLVLCPYDILFAQEVSFVHRVNVFIRDLVFVASEFVTQAPLAIQFFVNKSIGSMQSSSRPCV